MEEDLKTYPHPTLDEAVTAIGGTYVITAEKQIEFQGEQLLVFSGHAIFDTTCCGVGGCAYALVPGFIERYRHDRDEAGRWLSRVRPIADARTRQQVTRVVKAQTGVLQVQFV